MKNEYLKDEEELEDLVKELGMEAVLRILIEYIQKQELRPPEFQYLTDLRLNLQKTLDTYKGRYDDHED